MTQKSHKSASISPTAHYTGHVWLRHGLSDERLATYLGKLFYSSLKPIMTASSLLGGPTLEHFLLARHQIIDSLLEQAIESGEVSQIIECAAGLSPRGLRFVKRYGKKITYIEADLEGMATLKRERLKNTHEHHRVVTLNVLHRQGADSLTSLANTLDKSKGLVIVTEGLINYFDQNTVLNIWTRFAKTLSQFPTGILLSDIHIENKNYGWLSNAFKLALSHFVRSRVYQHFENELEVQQALTTQGFKNATLHNPKDWAKKFPSCKTPGADLVRVIEARIQKEK
ncbi:MAG: class I SAM-dependent methyltransferase [Deltaproteobacteria bacterium]|nr:MAG: class I SAM-dependent methyltransferase [Deltaproteobacteria bacterium]